MAGCVKMVLLGLIVVLSVISSGEATLNPTGTKCGTRTCSTAEYCSVFDSTCRKCSDICDPSHHNHESSLCVKDCQEYLHDQRYVLRADLARDPDLGELSRLKTLVVISLCLTIVTTLVMLFLLVRTFIKPKKIQGAWWKIFEKKWGKKARNKNKVHDDIDGGTKSQQQPNTLKVTMPTISESVTSSTQSSNGNSTSNTTSTPISRRFPTEDTVLDFAYDNPAMTPSPEAIAQPKSKRESSF